MDINMDFISWTLTNSSLPPILQRTSYSTINTTAEIHKNVKENTMPSKCQWMEEAQKGRKSLQSRAGKDFLEERSDDAGSHQEKEQKDTEYVHNKLHREFWHKFIFL